MRDVGKQAKSNLTEVERCRAACVDAYYADIHPAQIVFDTNRQWTTRLSAIAQLYPAAKVICCVRSPAWALDSIERLLRKNPLEPSGIFKFDPGGTVYSRAEGLMSASGMIGFALAALREAVFHDERHRLLLVRFETLTADPHGTLARIYDFIGEPEFRHDPANVETNYEDVVFDARLGTPGLHHVGAVVRAHDRTPTIPPDLFARYDSDMFWNDHDNLPHDVMVL